MTRIKSKRTNYPNESLSIQKVESGTLPGTIFISSSSSSDYSSGYFDKADLARALIEVGFTPQDLAEPTPEEKYAAMLAEMRGLANGTVIEVTSPYAPKTQYHHISGKWERDNDIVRYMALDFMSLESTYTIKYNPKED